MSTTTSNDQATLEVDVLVIGGGMAGMTAAAYAARHGRSVVVVEKGADIGGSAVLSGGGLWTASSLDGFRARDPESDSPIVELLVDGFEAAGKWVEDLGVQIAPPMAIDQIQGYPSVARVFDNLGYIQRCRTLVQEAGGWVVTAANVVELVTDQGRVVGAVVEDRDGRSTVRSPWTILATGGFQGSAELRTEHIGAHASELLVRSNQNSTGDGLRLAMSVGAALNDATENFYGHLLPWPLARPLEPRDYLRLAQIYSARTLLLDRQGRRFVDESEAYYLNAVAVSRQPDRRALLVADDAVRQLDRTMYGSAEQLDRPEEARLEGAHVAICDTLEELDRTVTEWGYRNVGAAVDGYNAGLTTGTVLEPARESFRQPYVAAPFFAMEVQPAITFTFGGIAVDGTTKVLGRDGRAVGGLLAAGVDIGVYRRTYAGGLALGLVTGLTAARVAVGE